ncbi:MAG TPA: proprotein convertase P-domain-containing protein [Ignavibacteria bacterium]|nr:proprotein convertase P-domain-containing protein [Ignavibacteria bacterium]
MKISLKLFFLLLILISTNDQSSAQLYWNTGGLFAGNSNSYISRGSSASLNITASFTLEAWLNPASVSGTRIVLQKREGGDPVGYTLLLSDGKVSIRTNSNTRLIGKTILQTNTWTHVAGTYNSASGLFSVYINGALDTAASAAGAAPLTNPDSLFIGKGFNNPYNGQMDEVRIWNRVLTSNEIYSYSRLSLGTNTGVYSGLVLSVTFQKNSGDGIVFTLNDQSGNSNHLFNRGVTESDLANRPSQTIDLNSSVELNGSNQYLAAPDGSSFSPLSNITLEAWIFPRSFNTDNVIIHKGTDNGSVTDYSLKLHNGKLQAVMNNAVILSSDDDIPLNQWSHVAYTFEGVRDLNTFYLNGKKIDSGVNNTVIINNGTDSFYVGGTMSLQDFDGFIDEVRIKLSAKYPYEINRFLFKSIEESNDLPGTEAVYNFDGSTESSVGTSNRLYFRNNGNFTYSSEFNNAPLSPLNRADGLNFSEGFHLKTSDRRIPESGTSGSMITDTLNVLWNEIIFDINVFVALNHTSEENLSLTLTSPSGQSVILYSSQTLIANHDNLVTVFDDQAFTTIAGSAYVTFSPSIKPFNNLNNIFTGYNTNGKWNLAINDNSPGDTGRLYGWGIQFNNRTSLQQVVQSYSLIQGFYNPSTDNMINDTVQLNVRSYYPPYELVDSSRRRLSNIGYRNFPFYNIVQGTQYYLQIIHRNSIETWSSSPVIFDPLTSQAEYDFRSSASQAFGNNMALVDNSPVRYGIYSGDVNQDDVIDLTDVISISNDASVFSAGYIATDVNGDLITDLTDIVITFNNASVFITAVIP